MGSNNEGNLNLKEAKLILLDLDPHAPNRLLQNLWKHLGWMKIKLFLWLVLQRKILTWDNIRRRGFLGPSRCQLCEAQEETIEHLLNNYPFTSRLWDSFAVIFQQSDRDMGCLFNTLTKWRKNFSNNQFHGSAWVLTPSFIIWNVWKERNNRIFNNVKNSSQNIFERILKKIKEIVSTTTRNLPSNRPSATDWRILCRLNLQGLVPQGYVRKGSLGDPKLDLWHPPPKGFLKFNIDGAFKGNLGEAGHGGVLRDDRGDIIFIFYGNLGKTTNNMVKLMAMEQSLEFLVQENRQNMIIEVDSEIVINFVRRISWGTRLEKASSNWRLIQVF